MQKHLPNRTQHLYPPVCSRTFLGWPVHHDITGVTCNSTTLGGDWLSTLQFSRDLAHREDKLKSYCWQIGAVTLDLHWWNWVQNLSHHLEPELSGNQRGEQFGILKEKRGNLWSQRLGCDGGKVTTKGSYRLLDDRDITHHNGWNFLLAKENLETCLSP